MGFKDKMTKRLENYIKTVMETLKRITPMWNSTHGTW